MRILWLSNKVQTNVDSGTTGTWLDAMARLLVQSGEVELGNLALGPVASTTRQDCGPIQQWVVPVKARPQRNGLPAQRFVQEIVQAVDEFSPDLVHIWGVEGYWGLLTARGMIRYPALLEMQGLKGACARVFTGGLSIQEQLACIGFKELIRQTMIFQQRKRFWDWWVFEREMIQHHAAITVQSAWVESWVKSVNPTCSIFHNDLVLRYDFYASAWSLPATEPKIIFTSAAYPVPYKGLHVAIRAVAILQQRIPNIKLHIAGHHQKPGFRQDGYVRWLNHLVQQLGVQDKIVWLGTLTAAEIVEQMRQASAMLLPTFIENCSTTMQEAMAFGVPLVASYVGGLPSLARDEESALFFPPGDEAMAAYQLERILTDRDLAERLSRNARAIALVRNDPQRILQKQLEIYRQVIAESRGKK